MSPKVLILILNWNKKDCVINLLGQINEIYYDNYECLVVDNNSNDTSIFEIEKYFPKVTILKNKENLGGTGGYNSGIRYVLENISCDYIWLIDNDAEITKTTLAKLVEVMDNEEFIGIAGSRIVDINNKDTTLELGSFLRWDTIGVKPNMRNKIVKHFDYKYVETDYVAICSAIIRCSAVEENELMDERYFIFWDDMDWGLQFKKSGYKVVAVPESVVFHPSFTETKRGMATDFYYGLRNPLLVYTKYTKFIPRLRIFYVYFSNYSVFIILLFLNRKWSKLKYIFSALYDFTFNKWGKCNLRPEDTKNETNVISSDLKIKNNKVLIIVDPYEDESINILNYLKNVSQDLDIYALIDEDRKEIYQKYFYEIIPINVQKGKTSLIYNIMLFIEIFKNKFDFSIGSGTTPYGYATKNYFIFNQGNLIKTEIGISSSFKLLISVIIGKILSLFITLIIFISSFRYSGKTN